MKAVRSAAFKNFSVLLKASIDCKSTQVQQLITDTGAKPLYLPRYPPDLNPMEMLWSVIKSFVRKFKPPSLLAMQIVLKTLK
ncbi:MAG: hypothetical protein AUK48_06370 [Oscillatoriales cyanobacterium CG2_30_44_21]|nr:MAG: hypothetical protein AUK48_06370 [Oscillatoriales cyanobacterium CG2_30_44_21]